jgi:exosome complex RNA-binding protein Rrp4
MAEKAEIEVVIGADGMVRIKTHGLRGESCIEETKALEQAVGKVERREKTREYYEQASSAKTGVKNR